MIADAAGVGGAPSRRRRSPGRGLLVPFIVFACLAAFVSLIGWFFYDRQARELRREAAAGLTAVRRLQSEQLSRWVADQRSDARLLRKDEAVSRPLERFLAAGGAGVPPRAVRDVLDLFRRSHGIQAITLLDRRLREVYSVPRSTVALTPRQRALAARAVRQGGTVFSGIYETSANTLGMDFATPSGSGGSSPSPSGGVFVLHMDPGAEVFSLLDTWPLATASGESLLVAVQAGRVVHVNRLRLRPVGPLARGPPTQRHLGHLREGCERGDRCP